MTLRVDRLLAHDFGEQHQSYSERDAILYALGLGLGTHTDDLGFIHEAQLAVLPSFLVTLASPGMWIRDPQFGVTFERLVHIAHDVAFLAPLPPAANVVGTARVESVHDRGAERGAELLLSREVRDADSGTLYGTIRQTLLLRGDGGFGGTPAVRAISPIPERLPDLATSVAISPRAAAIYRLSGDWNPLHIDPDFARAAGFDRPILHGLCSYGTAGLAVARAAGFEAGAIVRLAARFTGIVFPGDVLDLRLWREADRVVFTAHAGDRKVLDDGIMEFNA